MSSWHWLTRVSVAVRRKTNDFEQLRLRGAAQVGEELRGVSLADGERN